VIHDIQTLLANNRAFVAERLAIDPRYFEKLATGQQPEFLWIGCSDSRVGPDRLTGAQPGDMFVHRNIANLVVPTDMNLLSVLQYAVDVLKVRHVIVCGHYGCGGVRAAMDEPEHGLIDHWLETVRETQQTHWRELGTLDESSRFRRLVELNVVEQVHRLGQTTIVRKAWARGEGPYVHGWVFDIGSGHLHPQTGLIGDDATLRSICKFHNGVIGH
jgi:carbonic anhydrase